MVLFAKRPWVCRLREVREQMGMSLEDTAKVLRMSPKKVRQIEEGTYIPSLASAGRICALLGVELPDLFPKSEDS